MSMANKIAKLLKIAEKESVESGEKAIVKNASQAEMEVADDILKMNPSLTLDLDPALVREVNRTGIESTFNKMPPRSSADLSAEVFEKQAPNFEMVGAPRTEVPKGAQNFQLKGEPYSGNVPMKPDVGPNNFNAEVGGLPMKAESRVPEVVNMNADKRHNFNVDSNPGLPAVIKPEEFIEPKYKNVSDLTPEEKLSILRGQSSLPLAAGAAGAAALTAGGLMTPKALKVNEYGSHKHPPIDGQLKDLPGFPSSDELPPIPLRNDYEPEILQENTGDNEEINEETPSLESSKATSSNISEAEQPSEVADSAKQEEPSKVQTLADTLAKKPQGEKFEDVQKRADMAELANVLGSAGDIIGGAISGTGPNQAAQALFKQNIALAQNMPAKFQAKLAMEEKDPDSSVSKNYREFLKRYGVNAPESITAAQIKEVLLPAAEKEALKKAQIQAQERELALRLEEKRKDYDLKREDQRLKQEKTDIYRQAIREDKDRMLARRQLEMAKNRAIAGGGPAVTTLRNRIVAADAIFSTAGLPQELDEKDIDKIDNKKLDSLPPQFIAELTVETNRMLTGTGVPAQSTFKKLMPSNMNMTEANIKNWITSNVGPANQAPFVKLVLKTAARIKRNSQKGLAENYKKYFSGTEHIRKQLPEDYEATLAGLGLHPDDLQNNVTLSTAEKKQTLEWAKKNNIPYDQAEQIIIERKRQQSK